MQVRDLIYLLQTRADPESELFFLCFVDGKDGEKDHYNCELSTDDCDFNMVLHVDVDEGGTFIRIPGMPFPTCPHEHEEG
jgi:hypothetical protein